MGYILGIDQGGTKTAAAIMDCDGSIVGYGLSRGACYADTGMDDAMSAVREAVDKALSIAGLAIEAIDLIHAGLTGMDWPEEFGPAHDALCRITGVKAVRVYNDCIIAMRGGTEKDYGAVVCAGTGLNVGIKELSGNTFAFGYYIDIDYHGAIGLGILALKSVFAAEAGTAPFTRLTGIALSFFAIRTVDELLKRYINGEISREANKLAPSVISAADEGDAVAASIIERFGKGIGEYAAAGIIKGNMLDVAIDAVLSGSVLKPGNIKLREWIASVIRNKCPKARICDAVYEPVVGACLLGFDEKMNRKPNERDKEKLKASCGKHGLIRL